MSAPEQESRAPLFTVQDTVITRHVREVKFSPEHPLEVMPRTATSRGLTYRPTSARATWSGEGLPDHVEVYGVARSDFTPGAINYSLRPGNPYVPPAPAWLRAAFEDVLNPA